MNATVAPLTGCAIRLCLLATLFEFHLAEMHDGSRDTIARLRLGFIVESKDSKSFLKQAGGKSVTTVDVVKYNKASIGKNQQRYITANTPSDWCN